MAVALPTTWLAYGIRMGFDDGVEETKFGDNYAQSVQRGINPERQEWYVSWENMTDSEAEALRQTFADLGTDYFTWTPEGQATQLKFRPQRGSFAMVKNQWDNWDASCQLRQCFDP